MKRISMILAAVVLVLGLSQCKKQEQASNDEGNIVPITLDVRANGSRIDVNPNNGAVAFEYGDVVYVASGQKYVGTLTNNGNTFAGNLISPTPGEPLYFFFLGNKTPEESLTAGSSTTCSVNISYQNTDKLPVISFATSNETFTGAGLYTAYFLNKAALVKFDVTAISHAPTCILGMNNKVTVNFSTNSFTYNQVDNGVVKLSGGSGERWVILLPQAALPEGVEGSVYSLDGSFVGTRPAIPAITANDYLDEGIALTATVETNSGTTPEGAINGKFTINDNGDRVYFSQGNLQYQASTNTWQFAEHQWDYIGEDNANISSTYSGWIDLFGWGTSGYNHGANCYQPWGTSDWSRDYCAYGVATYNLYDQTGKADWGYNAISNGGNTEGLWNTLSFDEWCYVLYSRTTLSGILYAKANVNGVNGVILLPDNWDANTYVLNDANGGTYESNTITATDWTNTLEANGAVFLPAAGMHGDYTLPYTCGNEGYYWSSSAYFWEDYAWCLMFGSDWLTAVGAEWSTYSQRPLGQSVRLVRY